MKQASLLLLFGCFSILIGQVDYQTEIQPIFDNNCGNCHLGNTSGGLNLSNYENLMAGGNSGDVIVPNDHANSLLWQRVNNGSMPPSDTLESSEVDLIAQWIDEGALELQFIQAAPTLMPIIIILMLQSMTAAAPVMQRMAIIASALVGMVTMHIRIGAHS